MSKTNKMDMVLDIVYKIMSIASLLMTMRTVYLCFKAITKGLIAGFKDLMAKCVEGE